MSEKSTVYNPKEIEDRYYNIWESRGYFEIDGNKTIQQKDRNFSIMMPPPNVTGSLHIGHALTFTLQDIITRYKRMDGFKTLKEGQAVDYKEANGEKGPIAEDVNPK